MSFLGEVGVSVCVDEYTHICMLVFVYIDMSLHVCVCIAACTGTVGVQIVCALLWVCVCVCVVCSESPPNSRSGFHPPKPKQNQTSRV